MTRQRPQNFSLTPDEVDDLIAEGITSAGNLANFRFFTNDFDTETSGIDIVATYVPPAMGGDTTFSFLFNFTETDVTKFNPATLDATLVVKNSRQEIPSAIRHVPQRLPRLQ